MSNRNEVLIQKNEIKSIVVDFSKFIDSADDYKKSQPASLVEQAVTFKSKIIGTVGNSYSVEILDPGVLTATTTFSLTSLKVTVTLQHDGTNITATPSSVVADFSSAPTNVTDLITVTGASGALMTASIEKFLTGGTDETIVTCNDVSELAPIDAISKITNLPVTIDSENLVSLFFANGVENKTYRIDIQNTTVNGSNVNQSVYVSVFG